jgi:ATP-dependent helicase/nuclease subunit B
MKSFLQRIAQEIASRFSEDPGQVCIVLPNRRAGLYLKKYLARELKKTSWAPQTYSVEDFITELSGCTIIDQAGLLFEFYQVHKDIHGDKAQDFDAFADWAQVLLKDFDEIDQYLVDPEQIFKYLSEARAITVWNLDGSPLTDQEKSYIEFYQSFLIYYQNLNKKLTGKKQVYQGLAYRIAAQNIQISIKEIKWKKVFFAGLNALSAAEEQIINFLLEQDKAEIYWDADEYYLKNNYQEAGDFIRDYIKKWPSDPVKWAENNFQHGEKTIHVFGVPGSMGQAQKAGQVIRLLKSAEAAPDRTALVLADEKLLLPVLYALPEDIGPVNVTMGYPFRYTNLYQLVSQLFQMQENAERFAEQRKTDARAFYVKDILKILAHPYISIFDTEPVATQDSFSKTADALRKKNRVFISPGELKIKLKTEDGGYISLNNALFRIWESPDSALKDLLDILELIRDRIIGQNQKPGDDFELDLEYLFHLSKITRKCRTMMETYPFINNLKTLRKILIQLLDSSRLPFTGEPLQGIQVMGVLETRAIDFENLVVLSVNEGILPSGRLPNSFIPFDIKSEFGLPTFQHKDAVFAYHFYHMLQRARNIFLLYDTEGDQMKGGEKSRFITQVAYELTRLNPAIKYKEQLLRPGPPAADQMQEIKIEKSPAIMERLMDKAARGFSPTSLNLYIRCPLRFYFQEVLGLTEAETIEETIEARTMGTAIHQVFQQVYAPFAGSDVDPLVLTNSLKHTEEFLKNAFREHYSDGDLEHGKNHLIFKASLFLVNQFIRFEAGQIDNGEGIPARLRIVSLESTLDHSISVNSGGQPLSVKIKGKTDRIDQWNEITRIIDYKTGLVDARELNLKSWDDLIGDPDMGKAFQLLLYAWLYYKNHGKPGEIIQSGNITLRKISSGFMQVKLPDGKEIDPESMAIFEDMLAGLLEIVLNPGIPFTQTEDDENCKNCPFISMCTR